MYEEKRFYGKRINWLSVLLKLLLLILILFLIWFVVYKTKSKHTNKVKGKPISENLTYLKDQYIKYFDEDDLPKNINSQIKVPLDTLYEEKASDTIYDKNGKECSAISSYGQITKVDADQYKLKVYLKCKNEADSILADVTKEEIINTKLDTKKADNKKDSKDTKNTKDSKDTKDTKNTKDTKTTDTKDSKNTKDAKTTTDNKNTNTNKNTSVTNRTTTNNNGSTSKTSTSTKTTTSTTTSSTSTTTSQTTPTPSTQVAVTEPSKPTVDEIVNDPSRIVYTEYKMVKYGAETDVKPYGKYVMYNRTIKTYKYCINRDLYNCHKGFEKNEANKTQIEVFLNLGYTEYEDSVINKTLYRPIIQETWSNTSTLDGWVFTGETRTHYRTN